MILLEIIAEVVFIAKAAILGNFLHLQIGGEQHHLGFLHPHGGEIFLGCHADGALEAPGKLHIG